FFQAEAEESLKKDRGSNIIYAVEEPETSQHPDHQLLLLEAFEDLAAQDNVQIILTTHVPGLANQLIVDSIRYLRLETDLPQIEGSKDVLDGVATTVGVLPNRLQKVKVIMYVPGKHDVAFFKHISKVITENHPGLPNIGDDVRVAITPTGGSSLKEWINKRY